MDPHSPFNHQKIPDKSYSPEYTASEIKVMNNRFTNQIATREDIEFLQKYYRESIKYLDRHLVRVFKLLEKSGELDNTMIIFVSDHGECFGENNQFWHGSELDPIDALVRIPLAIKFTNGTHAGRHNQLVQQADILPTLADQFGWNLDAEAIGQPVYEDGKRVIISKSMSAIRATDEDGHAILSDNELEIVGSPSKHTKRIVQTEGHIIKESKQSNTQESEKLEQQLRYLGYK